MPANYIDVQHDSESKKTKPATNKSTQATCYGFTSCIMCNVVGVK